MIVQVEAHENVVHIRALSQNAGPELEEQLKARGGSAAILCSDVNCHPDDAARAMQPLLRHLVSGAWVILTLKMRGSSRDRSAWETKLPVLLGCEFRRTKLVWLLSNTDFETTWVGQVI